MALAVSQSSSDSQTIVRHPEEHPMDPKKLERWVQAHDKSMRPAVRELAANVQYVSHSEFLTSLDHSIHSFSLEVGDQILSQNCVSLVQGKKSNLWVFQLAQRSHKLPESFPGITAPIAYMGAQDKFQNGLGYYPKHVVLFDDASYSGQQLSRIVGNIFRATKIWREEDSAIPFPKVYLVVPYMTERSR